MAGIDVALIRIDRETVVAHGRALTVLYCSEVQNGLPVLARDDFGSADLAAKDQGAALALLYRGIQRASERLATAELHYHLERRLHE